MDGWLTLAAVELGRVSRHAQRYGSTSNHWFLITVLVGIGLLWLGLYYWDRYRQHHLGGGGGPRGLFHELCKVHELSRAERGLLMQVVERCGVSEPAQVFVDPGLLRGMSDIAGADAAEFVRLTRKLFGNLDAAPVAVPALVSDRD